MKKNTIRTKQTIQAPIHYVITMKPNTSAHYFDHTNGASFGQRVDVAIIAREGIPCEKTHFMGFAINYNNQVMYIDESDIESKIQVTRGMVGKFFNNKY